MDVFKTPGAFSWCELATTDVDAARTFYSQLFNWGSREMDMPEGKYVTLQVGEESVGGLMKIPERAQGMPPTWACYVTVKDVDATLKKVEALGGKVCVPPIDVPSVGRLAGIQDPQGAMLYVISYLPQNGA